MVDESPEVANVLPAHATTSPPGPLIFISAAEPSADLHGAALIRATHAILPHARFVGVAGPEMVESGCESIFNMSRHAAMLLGAVRSAGRALRMIETCDRHLRRYAFDAAVVMDSPTLHLPLAGRAHALGIPVLYYIAPQLWAWGAHRIYKLRHSCDRVAVILPFEEDYFRSQGVDATFVGHPLAERCTETDLDGKALAVLRRRGGLLVALLPGSRRHVVESMLPGQLDVARQISEQVPAIRFGVSVANAEVSVAVERVVSRSGLSVEQFATKRSELVRAADLALVASGTSTLEVALHHTPMVVMYHASRLFYHLIGRWIIRTPYYALPNLLARREIVPEFVPYHRDTGAIADCAIGLLQSTTARERMIEEIARVTDPLRRGRSSERTAAMLLEMIDAAR